MRKKFRGKASLLILTIAVFGTALTGCKSDELTPLKDAVKAELGVEMSTDAADYVECSDKVLKDTVVDVSGVDITMPGEYEMTVTYKKEIETIKVTVEDTTAPEAEVDKEVVVLAGEALDTTTFVKNVIEYSDNVTMKLADEKYSEAGEYDNTITLTDGSGNASEYTFHVIVCVEPVLEGIKDITTEEGSEADYLEGVTASDMMGNDLTDSIVVDSNNVDLDTPGEYKVTYTVENQYGYSTTEEITVTVTKKQTASGNSGNATAGNSSGGSTGGGSHNATYPDWTGPALYEATFDGTYFYFYHDCTHQGYFAGCNSASAILCDLVWNTDFAKDYPGGSAFGLAHEKAEATVMGDYKNTSPNVTGPYMTVVYIKIPFEVTPP